MKLCQSFVIPRRRSSNLVCSCFFSYYLGTHFFSGYFSVSFPRMPHMFVPQKAKQNSLWCFFSMQQKYEKCRARSPLPTYLRPYIHFPLINPQQLSLSPIRFFMLFPLSLSSSYDLQPLSIPPRTRHVTYRSVYCMQKKRKGWGPFHVLTSPNFMLWMENIKKQNELRGFFPLFLERQNLIPGRFRLTAKTKREEEEGLGAIICWLMSTTESEAKNFRSGSSVFRMMSFPGTISAVKKIKKREEEFLSLVH